MIHVDLQPEPPAFDEQVRRPGLRAIAELLGESPPKSGRKIAQQFGSREAIPADQFRPYWTQAIDDLMTAYRGICAYSCFRIHPVTGAGSVDHFAPKSRNWAMVYEWSNYRLACSRLNSRKRDFEDVLDPFEIEDGWFQMELVGFQVIPAPDLRPEWKARVQETIDRLKLNDNAFLREREERFQDYEDRHITLNVLEREAPFIAMELRRQGRLRPGDE